MGHGRLLAALQAIDPLVGRPRSDDRLGLVAFDDSVLVPIPAGAIGDGAQARDALSTVHPARLTNLSSGLLRVFQEAPRVANGDVSKLVLLSDDHANQGATAHNDLERFTSGARGAGVTTSTIGIGLGYDEDLLAAISRGGAGDAHFAEEGDAAGAALATEVEGLLEQSVQAASLTVRPSGDVTAVRLFNDLPANT